MIRMRVWMFMVLVGVGASAGKNHNGAEHALLCDLLKAVVTKWADGGKTLSDPLRKALKQTIFGNESEKDMEAFRSKLPDAYNDKESNSGDRSMWCGQPFEDSHAISNANQPRWPGHSVPHDMVCLCTAGANGWPINGSDTLCGKGKDDLGGGSEGWGNENRKAETQLKATWFNVTSECLQSDEKKGENLKDALDKFINALVPKPGDPAHPTRKQFGEGTPNDHTACTGTPPRGVCVMYYPKMPPTPWYIQLQNAIPEEEKFQEEKKKREEEEKRRQKEGEQITDEPHAEVLKSASTTPNQTEQNKHDSNLTDKIRKLNLTRSSSITRPTTWLLTTIIMI